MTKSEDLYLGLLAYRSAPLHNGLSPAELMTGRDLRATLPVQPSVMEKKVNVDQKLNADHKEKLHREKQAEN